jgi:hypothetical protein
MTPDANELAKLPVEEDYGEPLDTVLDSLGRPTLLFTRDGTFAACTQTESGYGSLATEDDEPIARRIVAAINYCQGMPTSYLELHAKTRRASEAKRGET